MSPAILGKRREADWFLLTGNLFPFLVEAPGNGILQHRVASEQLDKAKFRPKNKSGQNSGARKIQIGTENFEPSKHAEFLYQVLQMTSPLPEKLRTDVV